MVNIEDETYTRPRPTYEIKFMRPQLTSVYFQVKLRRGAVLGADSLVKSTIIEAFGKKGRRKIGSTLYAIEYVSELINKLPKDHLLDIKIGLTPSNYVDSIELGIDQYPILSGDNIKVILA